MCCLCVNKFLVFYSTILISEPMWSQIRRMSAPAFTSNMLKNYFNIIVEQSIILTEKLEQNGLNKNEIILLEYLSNSTFIMACGKIT